MTLLGDLVTSLGAHEVSNQAEHESILNRITPQSANDPGTSPRSLIRMADIFETQALSSTANARTAYFSDAFSCWKSIHVESSATEEMYDHDYLPTNVSLAFHIAISGTLAERPSEAQHALAQVLPRAEVILASLPVETDWRALLLRDVALAASLLVRKGDGWSDVRVALQLMDGLRARQSEMELSYLGEYAPSESERDVVSLVACYHLAQMITTAGSFIQTGQPGSASVLARLDRHQDLAVEAAEVANDGVIARLARLTNTISRALVTSSIWTQVEGMGLNVTRFAEILASKESDSPLLELWPSQQEALQRNLLDNYSRAILVEMPTSAGKTLLAKFSIVQTLALNPGSTIAYVVPTRVLVNQVVDELRRDFRGLNLTVEQAVPAFELDPTEDALLSDAPSVLVTTAEKMDLLIRENHPSLKNLSQIVVDEAHNLGDGVRGARLELLLATIRRDRPNARFLLLSPFLPDAKSIVGWLGGDRALPPIDIRWRPNRRVVAAIETIKHANLNYEVVLRASDAADNSNLTPGTEISLSRETKRPPSLAALTQIAVRSLRARKGVTLVVCYGKVTSMQRAEQVAQSLTAVPRTMLLDAVLAHLSDELGPDNPLGPLLEKGVAYHHAGMSMETRRLVEHLVHSGDVHTVCGTTTLSQGANFPINNVIIESLTKGRGGQKLSYSDFWNTAGRAGRGRFSDLGVIAFPVHKEHQREAWNNFFKEEAQAIASQLSTLVANADDIGQAFDFKALYSHETLSPFLQYLAHAMRVSGAEAASRDVEDLLRNSLVYRQTLESSQLNASRLLRLCREYLRQISGRPGLVALADGTGFSTTTVSSLQYRAQNSPGVFDKATWEPENLFGADVGPLEARIEMLGNLPEMKLGQDETDGRFSPLRAALILRDWVNGVPIPEMVEKFGNQDKESHARAAEFTSYLYSSLTQKASWGMGALQRVSWAGTENNTGDGAHVPSMIYYGVRSKEAVWMRMAGLPREGANRAAELWTKAGHAAPGSYAELRSFLGNLSPDDWEKQRGSSAVSGEQMQLLWKELG